MAAESSSLALQVRQQLQAIKGLAPTQEWLRTFLATQRQGLPANTLVKTASFRLLASDIKTSLDANVSPRFPPDIVNATVKEKRLFGSIVVQLLDIEDMSRSRWTQIEELEAEERGEMTKGREIIRLAPAEDAEQSNTSNTSSRASYGPHKLLVEDIRGTKIYAIEMTRLEGIHLRMDIGCKLVLKDPIVTRGVVLLDASPKTTVLGGKIESLHTNWRASRKNRLRAVVQLAGEGAA